MQLQAPALASTPQQLPPGLRWFPSLVSPERTLKFHQFLVLLLTFAAYAAFHASRKPPSIVKSILTTPINQTLAANATAIGDVASSSDQGQLKSTHNDNGWEPFDGPRGPHRLGELDLSFLLSYAIGMYFSGHIADTIDLRIFLTVGMVGSGIFVVLFGLGFFLDLHSLGAFIFIQAFCGLFQSIGWPCVVAVVGNWFGKAKRGLIMGVWNSHTSVGNILGSLVASAVLVFGWGWSFLVPGILIMLIAAFVYLFLVVRPENIGFELSEREVEMNAEGIALVDSVDGGVMESKDAEGSVPIGFLDAWRLPHVASYAFCLFFSKLVAYTFLYWLPFYIRHTAVAGVHLSHKKAGILSTVFDIGGVFGGITAGFMSDMIEARAVTAITFLMLSMPTLILYRLYGSISMLMNIVLMFVSGLLVNGPYALITTAVAADLGTQSSTKENSRALATVTAIIDGTGSVGAALGPLLAGYISTRGWNSVFFMLILSTLFAGFFLLPVVKNEIKGKRDKGKWLWSGAIPC